MPNPDKIKSLEEIQKILEKERTQGRRIVQCHGVFDLLHPGHIRHFQSAREQGSVLVVSVTPDHFVNKGPGRPAFNERLRLESIAALQDVDYVVLNDSPDAVSAIRKVRPTCYVKGAEYADHTADITGKIRDEERAVQECGGRVFYTEDITFSSSSLLNQYLDGTPREVHEFLGRLKQEYSGDGIIDKINALQDLKVLIVGDAIIDEYQYISPLGQSGKGLHMVAQCLHKELFLGGSLIIANHIAQFVKNVTLLTAVGKTCPHQSFIEKTLAENVTREWIFCENTSTLVKKRYVLKDGNTLSKLFETYSERTEVLGSNQTKQIIDYLSGHGSLYDLVLVCDFGNGFTNPRIIDAICQLDTFLALNTQVNSGNRGFNVITNYRRADYISINEPELRLSAHDKISAVEGIAADTCQIMRCANAAVTQGVNGVLCYSSNGAVLQIPAFATSSVDRIGAGDSFLALSALCFAKKYPAILAGFIGSVAAAMSVQTVGNQEAVKKIPLCKFITRLMK